MMRSTSTASRSHPALAGLAVLGLVQASPLLAQEVAQTSAPADISVEISDITAVGSSIDAQTLRAILLGDLLAHAQDVAALQAESITIPRITVTITSGESTDIATYSDIVFADVTDGIAATLSMGSSSLVYSEGQVVTMGEMRAAEFSIADTLAYYGLVSAADTEAFVPLYRDLFFSGGNVRFETGECAFGAVSMAEFSARPLRTGFLDMLTFLSSLQEMEDDENTQVARVFRLLYGDLISSFRTSEIQFDGLSCDAVNKSGPMHIALGPVTVDPFIPGHYPAITISDMVLDAEIDGRSGFIALNEARFKGFDYSGLVAALADMPDDVDDDWFKANVDRLIPRFEGFSLAGFQADVPSDEYIENVRFSIGSFDLELGNYQSIIPTLIRSSLHNFVMDVRPYMEQDEAEDFSAFMRAAGLTELDMSYMLDISWDAARETIALEALRIDVADIGALMLSGEVANAGPGLFSLNETAAMLTAMGLSLTDVALDVTDSGAIAAGLTLTLAQSGNPDNLTPAQYRPVFAETAGIALRSALSDIGYEALAEAVIAFLREGNNLTIAARAKDGGVGMIDFVQAENDPQAFVAKFDIKARVR